MSAKTLLMLKYTHVPENRIAAENQEVNDIFLKIKTSNIDIENALVFYCTYRRQSAVMFYAP